MVTPETTKQAALTYSHDSRMAFYEAQKIAMSKKTNIGFSELARGIIKHVGNNNISATLTEYNITLDSFRKSLLYITENRHNDALKSNLEQGIDLSPHAKQVVTLGANLARDEGAISIEPKHLLMGIAIYTHQFAEEHSMEVIQ